MATYISLLTFTEQGVQSVKESPDRVTAAGQLMQSMGAKMTGFYYTMGEYDAVAIMEAPDDETATKVALAVSGQGNVRTQSLRAFSVDEFRGILGGIP